MVKLLSNVDTPHYLHLKLIGWGLAAEHDKYNSNPARTLRTAQVKYLEKWLQMQKYHPRQVPTNLPGSDDQVFKQRVSILLISCIPWFLIEPSLAIWTTWMLMLTASSVSLIMSL